MRSFVIIKKSELFTMFSYLEKKDGFPVRLARPSNKNSFQASPTIGHASVQTVGLEGNLNLTQDRVQYQSSRGFRTSHQNRFFLLFSRVFIIGRSIKLLKSMTSSSYDFK